MADLHGLRVAYLSGVYDREVVRTTTPLLFDGHYRTAQVEALVPNLRKGTHRTAQKTRGERGERKLSGSDRWVRGGNVWPLMFRRPRSLGLSPRIGVFDMLLTCEWPSGFAKSLPSAPPSPVQVGWGTQAVAQLVTAAAPRYHFCGAQNVFYARPPYVGMAGKTPR